MKANLTIVSVAKSRVTINIIVSLKTVYIHSVMRSADHIPNLADLSKIHEAQYNVISP